MKKSRREEINRSYNAYIDSYEEMLIETGEFIQTSFLIFRDLSDEKANLIAFPLSMELIADKAKADQLLDSIVRTFPSGKFSLEMIMYSSKGISSENNENVVMFGARDFAGSTIHTAFTRDKKTGGLKLKKLGSSSFHIWLPALKKGEIKLPSGIIPINDGFLNEITLKYTVANSLSNL